MKSALVTAVLGPILLLTACGDDGGSDSSEEDTTDALSGDEADIRDVVVESLLDPRCELLTDDYLIQLSLFDAATPEEACDERLEFWQEPQYDEDDVLVSDIVVNGEVATAVVGSEYTNIETTYELMKVDGSWKVSCDDFTCDHLG